MEPFTNHSPAGRGSGTAARGRSVAGVIAHVDGGHLGDVEGVVLSEVPAWARRKTRLASLLSGLEGQPDLDLRKQKPCSCEGCPFCLALAQPGCLWGWAAGRHVSTMLIAQTCTCF